MILSSCLHFEVTGSLKEKAWGVCTLFTPKSCPDQVEVVAYLSTGTDGLQSTAAPDGILT